MKTTTYLITSALAALTSILFVAQASAQITLPGPNPGTSSATIKFNDTNSTVPPSGTTNVTQSTGAWNGTLFSPLFPTDPITSDFATGNIMASGSGTTYSVLPGNIQLSQVNATSGFALLIYSFTVEFPLTSNLLPQFTLFPAFNVSGTVGSSPGSFASVTGTIDYYDVTNAAYNNGLLDTVTYSYFNNTPGTFTNQPVSTFLTNGFTPLIPAGANLTIIGTLTFTVDPSSISAQSFPAPEPSAGLLALVTGLPLLLRRRRG